MARPLRLQYPSALYHITARGNERKNIYRTDTDRQAFLRILSQAIERYRLILHAYVLMTNHYHLLLETQEANLSLAMRHLNGVYTSYFNRTHRRIGHLFQGRYKAILVEKESYLLELSRYIHLNPHRVRMGVGLGQYRWSSYPEYIGTRKAPAWLRREEVLGYFGRDLSKAQVSYRRYMEEGIRKGVENPWEKVLGQVVLGGEKFIGSIRAKIGRGRDREIAGRRQLEDRPSLEAIKKQVQKALPMLRLLKKGNRSNPERAIMMYLGREMGGLSLKDLARRYGLDESTVSQAAGRVARLRLKNPGWARVLLRIEKFLRPNP